MAVDEANREMFAEHFELWFRLYAPGVLAYAARRVGAIPAEDICSQTFAEAWRHQARFDPALGNPRAWLYGIAANLIHRHYRAESRRLSAYVRRGAVVDAVDDVDDAISAMDAAVRWQSVAMSMSSLRSAERDVVWLAASGLTYTEIAVRLEVPVGTVRSRFARLRAKLASAGIDGFAVLPDPS